MSAYQYYAFRAVDRSLTEREMAELRSLSTRATITATSFQNEYHYGDFRGDPLTLVEKYFDAFVYVANWGTRRFMLRLPAALLPRETANRYEIEPGLQVRTSGDHVILEFALDDEEPEWAEGEGWLDSLLPLRADIAHGDLRALYIGWLSAAWVGDDDEDEALREPPVPPGLNQLSVPLRKLADFLRADPDLIAAAASRSEAIDERPESTVAREEWLRQLPNDEKTMLLLKVMQGRDMEVRAELLRRFLEEKVQPPAIAHEDGRTMGELLAAAEEHRKARERREQERAAKERERRAREEAEARARYLQDLAYRREDAWLRIESLLAARRGPEYDQAAQYVVDLRDVAQRDGTMPDFLARVQQLRARHASRPAFIRRLDAAGL